MLMKWDLTQSGSRDQISTKQMTWPWIIEQGKNTKDMSMNITSVEDKNIRNLALLITILVAAIHNIILASFDWQFYIIQRWFSLLIRVASPPIVLRRRKWRRRTVRLEIIKGLEQSVHIILLLYLKNVWVKAAINLSRDIFCLFEVIKV